MFAVKEILTIPLQNLKLDPPTELNLGDSKIIPWAEAPNDLRGAIFGVTREEWPFLLQTPRRDEQPRSTLDRALTVFKLFKDSLVLSVCVFQSARLVDHLPHYTHWEDKDRGVPLLSLDEYEKPEFARFWREFIEISPGNFAVYRFHLADYRPYLRDRFVDYVESLEYLLAPDSGEGEIAYKFRSRGVLTLGFNQTAGKRTQLYNELRTAYEMRSAIVHGNANKEEDLRKNRSWEYMIRPVRMHDREAIKFFFRAGCLYDADKRREFLNEKLLFCGRERGVTGIADEGARS